MGENKKKNMRAITTKPSHLSPHPGNLPCSCVFTHSYFDFSGVKIIMSRVGELAQQKESLACDLNSTPGTRIVEGKSNRFHSCPMAVPTHNNYCFLNFPSVVFRCKG